MMANHFRIGSLTLLPVSATESRVDMTISDNRDPESADESIAFSVLVTHKHVPTLQELELAAVRRVQELLGSQTEALSRIVDRPHK
jgi:hypothetical protein